MIIIQLVKILFDITLKSIYSTTLIEQLTQNKFAIKSTKSWIYFDIVLLILNISEFWFLKCKESKNNPQDVDRWSENKDDT